jgi:hypothetical protein
MSAADFVREAITPIRRAAGEQPLVLAAIVDALRGLDDELTDADIDTTAVRTEIAKAERRRDDLEAADTPDRRG